ncbi:MAG: metallophosphoesterase [Candidatus Aminicenantes bacterium]
MFGNRMNKKFNKIHKQAVKPENLIPFHEERNRVVIFSDHHKGDASAADDFRKNANLYRTALSYYKNKGFKLILLGDNEELWENRYDQILPHYQKLIQKEVAMSLQSPQKKKLRIYGNHDKEVSLKRFRKFYQALRIHTLDEVDHREGICLGKHIFLIHGHQGRFFDDKAWRVSRWAVQCVWKTIQKLFRIGMDGPAENFKIRDDLELKYYHWARKKRVLLICGHTHRAVFGSLTHYDRLRMELQHLKNRYKESSPPHQPKIKKEIQEINQQIKNILHKRQGIPPKSFAPHSEWPVPCYFNDGCCGYTNGITCIEMEEGMIRLIKWQRQTSQRIILEENSIHLFLQYIKQQRPIDDQLEPEEFTPLTDAARG